MKCINCRFVNPHQNRYCGRCGTLISRNCHSCDAVNPLDHDYCGHCGTALGISSNRFGRQEPSATYSYFPASSSALTVKPAQTSENGIVPTSILQGVRRVATVIVADVMKSTDMLSQVGSELWVELMSKLLQMMEAQIYRYGGQVDQFRGDGLVAFFGARDAHEDDPERAVLAALAMQEGFERYKDDFEPFQAQSLKLRVGINTDELIVAQVGTLGKHTEDTAMGEAIALAARLEAAAEPGTILVSESTHHLVENKFHWINLGKIDLKGINAPVQVYRPIALRTEAELLQEMQTYIHSAPLIGRYQEYNQIRQKIDRLKDHRGEILLISGERGLGKTYLIQQIQKDLSIQKQIFYSFSEQYEHNSAQQEKTINKVLWLRGWCTSYEQPSPFFMWRILLKIWLGVTPDEDQDAVIKRLETYCEFLWPQHYLDYLPILSSLLALSTETKDDPITQLDAQGYQGKLLFVMKDWLQTLSQKMPLVISFSNIQWANAGSIDLLREVISLSEDHPILFLLIYRPDRNSLVWHFQHYLETELPHRITKLVLKPFTREESAALIEHILQPNKLDPESLEIIANRTEGNPYFIRELVNSLVNDGMLYQDPDSNLWRLASDITSSDIPETVQSLIHARIDKLSQTERKVLQVAAVIGFIFWDAVIKSLIPEEVDMTEALNQLEKVGLIEERGSFIELGMSFQFSSTLIRDVAYDSILSTQKKNLHLQIGRLLQEFESNPEISPSLIAHHFHIAGDLQLELQYRIKAAEQSRNYFSNQEAYQEYTRALDILDLLFSQSKKKSIQAILMQRFELIKSRIEVLYHLGRVHDAHHDARTLLDVADQIEGDPTWRIDALLMQPGVNYTETQEMLKEGIPQAEEALRLSREIGDSYREMISLAAIAGHRFLMSDPSWQQLGDEAIAIAERLGDKKTKVELLLGLAGAYGMDKLEMGLRLVEKAQPLAQEIDYKGAQVEMLYWIGTKYERSGDYYRLLTEYEEKRLNLAKELGWRLVEARSLMFIGQINAIYLGDYEGGLPLLKESEKLWQDVDQRLFVYLRAAQVHIELDQFDQAKHYLSLAKPLSVGFVQSLAIVGYRLVKSILLLKSNSLDSLLRVLENTDTVLKVVDEDNLVSKQYRMAAACKAAQAELKITRQLQDSNDMGGYEHYKNKAVDSSGLALETFNEFGFTQVIETVSEEVLYYHGLALKENEQFDEGDDFLRQAHQEVIRKFNLIPEGSHYRKTFMNTELHRLILDEGKKYQ